MSIVVSIDLGTTKITSLAFDIGRNELLARGTQVSDADDTSNADRVRGRSEWDARKIGRHGFDCLKLVCDQLGARTQEIVGIGITGQQHGVVLTDRHNDPLSPLINWQDRRSLEVIPGLGVSCLDAARDLIGVDSWRRTGCQLQPGFMAVTLFWLKMNGLLPESAHACFIMDYFGSLLTGQSPITEPSCAGSSGVLDVRLRQWSDEAIDALALPRSLFPEVREANERIGILTHAAAEDTGLPVGTPVFAPIGDHQASFIGSVSDRRESVLVNVGTGAQVAVYTEQHEFLLPIELRPYPCGGNLLSNVGLAGGWAYQITDQFFRDIGRSVFNLNVATPIYEIMNQLAGDIVCGADGLRCDPFFSGTRRDPTARGEMTGLSPQNFTAGHFARAVLEGMARSLHDGYLAIQQIAGGTRSKLVAAGNGLRENQLLAEIVSQSFGMPLNFTRDREEAAYGAALVAAIGLGAKKQ
ncbi:MAG: FGGY family carbohydrate kinase [Planctomycetales bacterium]|jgi:sugar (pentulose or hexulose) kinase|nr:FGGY family carbohydrate kinase [Planctomycetales bacterium]